MIGQSMQEVPLVHSGENYLKNVLFIYFYILIEKIPGILETRIPRKVNFIYLKELEKLVNYYLMYEYLGNVFS